MPSTCCDSVELTKLSSKDTSARLPLLAAGARDALRQPACGRSSAPRSYSSQVQGRPPPYLYHGRWIRPEGGGKVAQDQRSAPQEQQRCAPRESLVQRLGVAPKQKVRKPHLPGPSGRPLQPRGPGLCVARLRGVTLGKPSLPQGLAGASRLSYNVFLAYKRQVNSIKALQHL